MAKTSESVTAMDESEAPNKKRKGLFGRKKKDEVRSGSEWVDTLHAAAEDEEEAPTGSPFALGEEAEAPDALHGLPEEADPEAAPEPIEEVPEVAEEPATSPWPETAEAAPEAHEDDASGVLPAEATETDEEVVLKELHLPRPDKLDLETRVRRSHHHRGERDAFYEKSWVRRQSDSMDDIHNYIDSILGTELDPARRRERLASTGFTQRSRSAADGGVSSVHVEGLDEDLMIAFTFPQTEFRGAKVVYETEGGYVIEVTRAIGGNDARTETQFYTVSRVGSVGHVLDRLRDRDKAALHEGRATPAVREALRDEADHASDDTDAAAGLPEEFAASEPSEAADVTRPPEAPLSKTHAEPAPTHPEGSPPSSPEAEYATTDPHPEDAVSEVTHESAPTVDTAPVAPPEQTGTETSPARDDADDAGKKRGGFGLFGRKKNAGDEPDEGAPEDPFGGADSDEDADAEASGQKKGRGLFGRRKKGDGEDAEDDPGAQVLGDPADEAEER